MEIMMSSVNDIRDYRPTVGTEVRKMHKWKPQRSLGHERKRKKRSAQKRQNIISLIKSNGNLLRGKGFWKYAIPVEERSGTADTSRNSGRLDMLWARIILSVYPSCKTMLWPCVTQRKYGRSWRRPTMLYPRLNWLTTDSNATVEDE